MNIKLKHKVADQDIDELVSILYVNFISKKTDFYLFDFTEVEFIANQELLVLSAILKLFYNSSVQFEVQFFKKGVPTTSINERIKKQIIQIWEVWQIWRIIDNKDYVKYFGIDGKSIGILKEELNYHPVVSEIYTRHGITPFISLDYINNYNQKDIEKIIAPIYQLNSVMIDILRKGKCYHPFTSQFLSSIITEEFYLNFLDHSAESSFTGFPNMAFMSISFQGKIDEKRNDSDKIQQIKKMNFETEIIPEAINFYFDNSAQLFKNNPHIQFSFLDFGSGIVNTLRDHYPSMNPASRPTDSDILKFAFEYFSSRHPINPRLGNDVFIPRGLFDCLELVNRYQGLLIVRSNRGKILYDFSDSKNIKSGITFSDEKFNFPGTLVSIYLPAVEDTSTHLISAIKPDISFNEIKSENKCYLNFTTILAQLPSSKQNLYNALLEALKNKIANNSQPTLTFFSFEGTEFAERRILKKTLYFLISDYAVNNLNNVIIFNFPIEELLDEVEIEILSLNKAYQNYKIHPLPIVQYNPINEHIKIRWLGVFDEQDKNKLNDLLFDGYSIAFADFNNPGKITGQLNAFDQFGNLKSNFPSRQQIVDFYDDQRNQLFKNQIFELLKKHKCILEALPNVLFLTNTNFYQTEYIEITNLVNDEHDCAIVSKLLFENVRKMVSSKTEKSCRYIGVTTSSHKILKSLQSQLLVSESDCITLDNYYSFENDSSLQNIDNEYCYILICDTIATGTLTLRLNAKLKELGSRLSYIGVLINTLCPESPITGSLLDEFKDRISFLYKYRIEKFRKTHFGEDILSKKIIRINPFTNRPITSSIDDTNFGRSVVFHSRTGYVKATNSIFISNPFLDQISVDDIKLGFRKYNNLVYPYFFETRSILKKISEKNIRTIFDKIQNRGVNSDHIQVFYPRKSGVEGVDLNKFKQVLKNHSIEAFEIDRYSTPEGWRFPHNTTNLIYKIGNNICLILDDGSCSGDSLIQMIDEIAFHSTKEIILLCFIGRINDHKREFFSRLSHIRGKGSEIIPISIYFVSHWHIAAYDVDANPNTKESVWLNDIINLSNTPQSIKNIAQKVLAAITPKTEYRYEEYKYLPKIKSENVSERVVPKKEILLVREELGKVIGYRLYKESFAFFDGFFKKYENKVRSKNRYKEIELLCAILIFEPYLYDRMVGLMPDVIEHIEDFVKIMLFSNDRIYDRLTYRWNKKDIIHLFFIVFKNEKLIEILKNASNFDALLRFTGAFDPALNYVLYKLLYYFPIKSQHFEEKKLDIKFKKMIFDIIEKPEFQNKELIKFYNFILSLPSRNDFQSQIEYIKINYISQNDPSYHDEKKSFNHNVSLAITTIRTVRLLIVKGNLIEKEKMVLIKECWFEILSFVNPILSFASSFQEFLVPYPYLRQLNIISSLRDIVGYNDDVILSLSENFNDHEKLKDVERNISKIQNDIGVNSVIYNLVVNHTSNLKEVLLEMKANLAEIFPSVKIDLSKVDEKWVVNVPYLYMDNLVRKEILTNIVNHSDKTGLFQAETTFLDSATFQLKIKNKILKKGTSIRTGEGIKCLRLLGAFLPFGFSYELKPTPYEFNQILTFKFY